MPTTKLTILALFLLCACSITHEEKIEAIKQKYSPEVINYFYKTAYYNEKDTRIRNISKWNRDIIWYMEGDTLPGDRHSVLKVMDELNAMDLPMSFRETTTKDSANFLILFGTYEELNLTRDVEAICLNKVEEGIIIESTVKIPMDSGNVRTITPISRTKRIFEEVTQGTGVGSDNLIYPKSLFYQNINYINYLPELDRQLIYLLYEPAIKPNYPIKQFEKDFGDVLYHVNGREKFLKYLRKNNISKKLVEKILESGLTKDRDFAREVVIKYSSPVNVFVKGEVYPDFASILKKAIKEINEISDNIKLDYIPNIDSLTHREGIYFEFVKDTTIEKVWSKITYGEYLKTKSLFLPPHWGKYKIKVFYKDHEKLSYPLQTLIPNYLYRGLCLRLNKPEAYHVENDTFHLKPEYRKILNVYYSHALPNGFTKEDLEWVLGKLEGDQKNDQTN